MATRSQSTALTPQQVRSTARLLALHGPPRNKWWWEAACTDLPTEAFFGFVTDLVRERCVRCPVQLDCLADAMKYAGREDDGFRAGTFPRDRDRIATELNR